MKTKNIFNNILLLGILCLPLVFSACSKNNKADIGESSNIKVINASEASTPQDFYLNDNKVAGDISYKESSSGYISTKSGNNQNAEFRTSGAITASTEIDLDANKHYSFFLNGEGTSSSIFRTEDDMSTPPEGKAKIRFVHLSSAANQNIDVSLAGNPLISGLSFKGVTGFSVVNPGIHLLKIFPAGSTTGLIDLNLSALISGKIYTVVISGSSNVTATLINNN